MGHDAEMFKAGHERCKIRSDGSKIRCEVRSEPRKRVSRIYHNMSQSQDGGQRKSRRQESFLITHGVSSARGHTILV